jgi:hypothetical protein
MRCLFRALALLLDIGVICAMEISLLGVSLFIIIRRFALYVLSLNCGKMRYTISFWLRELFYQRCPIFGSNRIFSFYLCSSGSEEEVMKFIVYTLLLFSFYCKYKDYFSKKETNSWKL